MVIPDSSDVLAGQAIRKNRLKTKKTPQVQMDDVDETDDVNALSSQALLDPYELSPRIADTHDHTPPLPSLVTQLPDAANIPSEELFISIQNAASPKKALMVQQLQTQYSPPSTSVATPNHSNAEESTDSQRTTESSREVITAIPGHQPIQQACHADPDEAARHSQPIDVLLEPISFAKEPTEVYQMLSQYRNKRRRQVAVNAYWQWIS